MKWTKLVIAACIIVIFTLTLAPRASASAPNGVGDNPDTRYISVFTEDHHMCAICPPDWVVIVTQHDSVVARYGVSSLSGAKHLVNAFADDGQGPIAVYWHNLYQASTMTPIGRLTVEDTDDETAISSLIMLACDLGYCSITVDVQYLR